MARRSHLWYSVIVRILTAIAALMSVAVMIVSAWTLASVITEEKEITKLLFSSNNVSEDGKVITPSDVPEGHKTHIIILLVCLGVAILTGFSQLVASLNALCSCSKNVSGRVKGWLVVNIITFLILLLCYLLPLSFNKDTNAARGFDDFGNVIKDQMTKLWEDIGNKELDEKRMQDIFGYTIVANNIVILIFIVLLGCCLRCGEYAYESVY